MESTALYSGKLWRGIATFVHDVVKSAEKAKWTFRGVMMTNMENNQMATISSKAYSGS